MSGVAGNINDSDGSSRYTEEEIIAELRDMGYTDISDDQIAHLKQALDKFLEDQERESMQNLIQEARIWSERMQNENDRIEMLITDLRNKRHQLCGDTVDSPTPENGHHNHIQSNYADNRALNAIERTIRETGAGTASLATTDVRKHDDRRDPIAEPTVRPIACPEPGLTGYRHDPVRRHALYQLEWKRHPTPGELPRMNLRWKVREYMQRRDFPLC